MSYLSARHTMAWHALRAGMLLTLPLVAWSQQTDIVMQSRARYAALHSYADTGSIVLETMMPGQPAIVERRSFVTYYQGPRQFYLDFRKGEESGYERLVLWSDGGAFNTWWSATQTHEVFEKGRGAAAFAVSAFPTDGVATLIPPLLFAKAGLHGALADFAEYRVSGVDTIGGRMYHRVRGSVSLAYQSGTSGPPQPTTLWIDVQTLLVRKVVQETVQDGRVTTRGTVMFAPVVDPRLDDARFTFALPRQ